MERTPPPNWCKPICANALSDGCVEKCAVNRKMELFLPETEKTIDEVPPFPLEAYLFDMNQEEQLKSLGYYTALLVSDRQGIPIEEEIPDVDIEQLIKEEDGEEKNDHQETEVGDSSEG